MPIINQPSQQHHQQQPQQHHQMMQQLQPAQVPQMQQQQQQQYTYQQQCQHMQQTNQIQQPVYQCQNFTLPYGLANQSFTSNNLAQMPNSLPEASATQCTCQHCPCQQQQQQPQPQQQPQQEHQQQLPALSSQQQFTPQLDHVQTNGTCQHQMAGSIVNNGTNLNANQQAAQIQNNPHNHVIQQQQQQHHHQHHRVQSIHQQTPQPVPQQTHQSLHMTAHLAQLTYQDHLHSPEVISQQQQRQNERQIERQVESRAHDYSRYANVQSLMYNPQVQPSIDYNQSSKYQEHVYYNQKPELPPYQHPPDYETFIKNRKMYAVVQHMTNHSESLVLHNAKDSSYENLKKSSLYSNLGFNREESSYTS
jgi:hypothetical protein